MQKHQFKGKTEEAALTLATEKLMCNTNDFYYQKTETKGLFGKGVEINVYLKTEILELASEKLREILYLMGIENIEINSTINERNLAFNINTNQNALLIGKNGKNLKALQVIVRQLLNTETNLYIPVLIDIENYKEKAQRNIVSLAHKLADEVVMTKEEVAMKDLNSFERRLVHKAIGKSEKVYTESVGEGPNRHLVIKPKE